MQNFLKQVLAVGSWSSWAAALIKGYLHLIGLPQQSRLSRCTVTPQPHCKPHHKACSISLRVEPPCNPKHHRRKQLLCFVGKCDNIGTDWNVYQAPVAFRFKFQAYNFSGERGGNQIRHFDTLPFVATRPPPLAFSNDPTDKTLLNEVFDLEAARWAKVRCWMFTRGQGPYTWTVQARTLVRVVLERSVTT